MILDRLLGDRQRVGDLLVRHSLRDVVQDLDLTGRERREHMRGTRAVDGELAEFSEHLGRDGGLGEDLLVDRELARADLADRLDQFLRRAVLLQVGGRAGPDRIEERLLFLEGGQHDDGDVRELAAHPLGRLDTTQSREIRFDDEDVRLELDRLRDGVLPVGDGGKDLHVGLTLEHLRDAKGGEPARVGQHDADRLLRLIGQVDPPLSPAEGEV